MELTPITAFFFMFFSRALKCAISFKCEAGRLTLFVILLKNFFRKFRNSGLKCNRARAHSCKNPTGFVLVLSLIYIFRLVNTLSVLTGY